MLKYVFSEYRESRGIGEDEIFSTEAEALEKADGDWRHLSRHDQKSYLNDSNALYWAYEIEITEEQLKAYEEGGLDTPLTELWTRTVKEWV